MEEIRSFFLPPIPIDSFQCSKYPSTVSSVPSIPSTVLRVPSTPSTVVKSIERSPQTLVKRKVTIRPYISHTSMDALKSRESPVMVKKSRKLVQQMMEKAKTTKESAVIKSVEKGSFEKIKPVNSDKTKIKPVNSDKTKIKPVNSDKTKIKPVDLVMDIIEKMNPLPSKPVKQKKTEEQNDQRGKVFRNSSSRRIHRRSVQWFEQKRTLGVLCIQDDGFTLTTTTTSCSVDGPLYSQELFRHILKLKVSFLLLVGDYTRETYRKLSEDLDEMHPVKVLRYAKFVPKQSVNECMFCNKIACHRWLAIVGAMSQVLQHAMEPIPH